MWGAWFLAGFLLLFTKRYSKEKWTLMHWMHALLGYFTTAVTIIFSVKIIKKLDGFHMGPHNLSGVIVLWLTILSCILGIATVMSKRCNSGKEVWKAKECNMKVAKVHKVLGWLLLFFSNITIFTGVGNYAFKTLNEEKLAILGITSFLLFVAMVGFCEFLYRSANRNSKVTLDSAELVNKVEKVKNWSNEDLSKAVEQKQ